MGSRHDPGSLLGFLRWIWRELFGRRPRAPTAGEHTRTDIEYD